MPTISDFPILAREWRSRFRGDRAFGLLAFLVGAATWAMIYRMNDAVPRFAVSKGVSALAPLAQDLLVQLVWTQIAGACLLAPLISAPLIARERESGTTEDLLLTPLSPLRLALEKWASGASFLLLVWLALWPLNLVALLLGNASLGGVLPVAALGLGCLAWGSALGTACSAHARRAALALRSAVGIALIWFVASLICANAAGEASSFSRGITGVPVYVAWFGRTNPVLCALDLLQPPPFLTPKWPFCVGFLVVGTALLLFMAARGLRKPLPDLPIISTKRGGRGGGVSGALSRLEMPLMGRFAPNNPVLGREARGKFRLRQPPIAVLVAEIVLALGVAVLYVAVGREAWINPPARETVFWGVAWTGFFVSLLAASAQGGAALARERENGTWEALRLSLLTPSQIVRGKLVAALATAIVLSFPAWPLLLECVQWGGSWTAMVTHSTVGIQPFQLVAAVLVWLGVLWLQTILGLLCSTRAKKSGGAIGVAFAVMGAWMMGSLLLFLMDARDQSALGFLAVTNPLVALAAVVDPMTEYAWASSGWGFAIFALVVGRLLLALTEAEVLSQLEGQGEGS